VLVSSETKTSLRRMQASAMAKKVVAELDRSWGQDRRDGRYWVQRGPGCRGNNAVSCQSCCHLTLREWRMCGFAAQL
jgi:hypothetical protein